MSEHIKQNRVIPPKPVALADLKPHPRNYQRHPDDELEHIMVSLREHGFYRNIVTAKDHTILAGHGVVEAARRLGYRDVPVVQLDYEPDDPRALKVLAGDNEISHLAEVDDRALTELIKELSDIGDLLGTGYDDMMLANLLFVTRPASEIADLDAAAQWVGMPGYDMEGESPAKFSVIMNFATEDDCKDFCHRLGLDASRILTSKVRLSLYWPKQVRDDLLSVRFTDDDKEEVHA